MKIRKYIVLLSPIILIVILFFTPYVAALPRNTYLINFISSNSLNDNVGFSNAPNQGAISYSATDYSLSILNFYGETQNIISKNALKENLEEFLEDNIDSANFQMYTLYYVLNSLEKLNYVITQNLKNDIETFLNASEQSGGGFSYEKGSNNPNLIPTYMAMKSYQLIGSLIPNKTLHKNWIISCYNTDGGYGETKDLSSSLLSTFYAILAFEITEDLSSLPNYNTTTLSYLKALSSINGGYRMTTFDSNSLLSSTYYCVKTLSLINKNEISGKTTTINWVLSHQNVGDGGFSEVSDVNPQTSSVASSYYAFETLRLLNAVSYLNEEIGEVTFNWFVLLIIFIVIGIIVALGYFIYRRRKI